MMKNAIVLVSASFLLFSCGGEAEPAAEEGVSTEVNETLKSEQELNDQVHELHDDIDEVLEAL